MTKLTPTSTRSAAKLCSNCGSIPTPPAYLRKGRCWACYNYYWRTGKERPPWYGDGRSRMTSDDAIRAYHARYMAGESVADLAKEAGVHEVTIYDYFRSLDLPLRLPKARPTCSNCGRVCVELRKGRCNPCYQWHRQYNEERPLKENVRVALRRTRLAPDAVVLALHARYMDGENITALANEAGIGRVTLWRRFADLNLELRGRYIPRPCSVCGRDLVLNEHGKCRSCAKAASRYHCPRCGIVVPKKLGKGETCDLCKDDEIRRAARWRPSY